MDNLLYSSDPIKERFFSALSFEQQNQIVAQTLDLNGFSEQRLNRITDAVVKVLTASIPENKQETVLFPPRKKHQQRKLPYSGYKIIGICGKPQSGKDLAAEYISSNYRDVTRMAFSDQIIPYTNRFLQVVSDSLSSRFEDIEHHTITGLNKTFSPYRKLLQEVGIGKWELQPNYWVDKVEQAVLNEIEDGSKMVIITGLRLPEDVEFIYQLGGEVWRVERPDNSYQAGHAVEDKLDLVQVTRTIVNPGDLAGYASSIEATLTQLSST